MRGGATIIDIDHVDTIETAHARYLGAENLDQLREYLAERVCPYCEGRFLDRELYVQHLRRANRSGLCLGDGPPKGL